MVTKYIPFHVRFTNRNLPYLTHKCNLFWPDWGIKRKYMVYLVFFRKIAYFIERLAEIERYLPTLRVQFNLYTFGKAKILIRLKYIPLPCKPAQKIYPLHVKLAHQKTHPCKRHWTTGLLLSQPPELVHSPTSEMRSPCQAIRILENQASTWRRIFNLTIPGRSNNHKTPIKQSIKHHLWDAMLSPIACATTSPVSLPCCTFLWLIKLL